MFAQLTLGAVLAAGGVALIRAAVPRRFERPFWAAGLVAAALVYVVLAFRAELSAELSVEVVGAGVFAMLALLGVRVSSWFLAAGWGAHALWDLGVPALIDTSFIPTYSIWSLADTWWAWSALRIRSARPAAEHPW
jgi:hypothetical protein